MKRYSLVDWKSSEQNVPTFAPGNHNLLHLHFLDIYTSSLIRLTHLCARSFCKSRHISKVIIESKCTSNRCRYLKTLIIRSRSIIKSNLHKQLKLTLAKQKLFPHQSGQHAIYFSLIRSDTTKMPIRARHIHARLLLLVTFLAARYTDYATCVLISKVSWGEMRPWGWRRNSGVVEKKRTERTNDANERKVSGGTSAARAATTPWREYTALIRFALIDGF